MSIILDLSLISTLKLPKLQLIFRKKNPRYSQNSHVLSMINGGFNKATSTHYESLGRPNG